MKQPTWHAIWEAKVDSRGARVPIGLATLLKNGDFCDKEPQSRCGGRLSRGLDLAKSQGLDTKKSQGLDVINSRRLEVKKSRGLEMCSGVENRPRA